MKKKFILIYLIMSILAVGSYATARRSFAIVIDQKSLNEANDEIRAYAKAIEQKQGLKVITLVDSWGIPDSIRHHLFQLYSQKNDKLIGAVFIGDIPIPMVRDAQHLTSAFKMDQNMDRRESCVPSDRFYDDFDLRFNFLGKDSNQVNYPYFYYSLSAGGAQTLHPSIFSGRIRPTDTKQSTRYEKLRTYLTKATQFKLHPEKINSVFVFQGNGSLTESNVAHLDEYRGWTEHLPLLKQRQESFSYMQHNEENYIKTKMMNELMRPNLSFAVLHHHGDFDTQYLGAYPRPTNTNAAIDYIKYSFRNQIRTGQRYGKNPDSTIAKIVRSSGVPIDWIANYNAKEKVDADSLETVNENLTLNDFENGAYKPNCRLINFDACYNGAFNHPNSIGNAYIFQPGKTLVAIGGSVNIIQDKWPDRFMGLMSEGMMAGHLLQNNCYLEWHIIGDPTFCFAQETGSNNVNAIFAEGNQWAKVFTQQIKKTTDPDLFGMAIYQLQNSNAINNKSLLNLLQNSPYFAVRLEAFLALKKRGGDDFITAMQIAARDNYELIQRFAVNEIKASGDPRVIPCITRILCNNNASARVAFNSRLSLQLLPEAEVRKAAQPQIDSLAVFNLNPESYRMSIDKLIKSGCNSWEDDIANLLNDSLDSKHALRQAGYMRIYTPSYLIPQICDYVAKCKDMKLQRSLLEALGWHGTAYTAKHIADISKRISEDTTLPEENRQEALKTWKRVTDR